MELFKDACKRFFIFLLFLPTSGLGFAAETFTWQQCVNEASTANFEIKASVENLRSSQYQATGAWSAFFPQLSGNAGYSRDQSDLSNYSVFLSASQNFFAGFQDRAKVSQAQANQRQAEATLAGVRAKASYDLKSAFANMTFAQGYIKLTGTIVERREANLRLVELRFESGRENKGSVLLSKAYLKQAKYEQHVAGNALSTAQTQLARVLGRENPDGLLVTGEVPVTAVPQSPDLQQLATRTPDHLQAIAQEEASSAGVTLVRSAFFPGLGATASAGRLGTEFFPTNDRWSVGLTLNVPIFSGGRDYFSTKSALAALSSSSANRENTDRQVLTKLRQAYSAYSEAVEKLKVDESFFEAASVRAEIARNKYNNGLISFDDWDIIENDLITREKNRLQSLRDRIVAEAAWEQAQGKGVIP